MSTVVPASQVEAPDYVQSLSISLVAIYAWIIFERYQENAV